jgi:hypothetical protein
VRFELSIDPGATPFDHRKVYVVRSVTVYRKRYTLRNKDCFMKATIAIRGFNGNCPGTRKVHCAV